METVGLFTMSLWALRKILSFLPNIYNFLISFSGGLMSQVIVIFLIVKIVPIFAVVLEKVARLFVWLMHKFE